MTETRVEVVIHWFSMRRRIISETLPSGQNVWFADHMSTLKSIFYIYESRLKNMYKIRKQLVQIDIVFNKFHFLEELTLTA